MKKTNLLISAIFMCAVSFNSCSKVQEMTLSEIDEITKNSGSEILSSTVSKPYKSQAFKNGKKGGVWNDSILDDPKTFNQLIAEKDGSSNAIIGETLDWLIDYDMTERKWKSRLADFEIETDKKNGILKVHYKIRDDAFWSWYGKDEKIPVTSDDFVFWFNEIENDPEMNSSGYGSHTVILPDGTEKEVQCVKIDEKRFDFIFPALVAEPLLSTNMNACPSFIYKKAKESGGAEAVKNLFGADCDVKSIPSCGMWFITEYTPGQRLVYSRNPDYWRKDGKGVSIPYPEKKVFQIVGDMNTDYLLFRQGKLETYSPRPEELSDVVNNRKNDYEVYNSDGSMGAMMWSFNQNPKNKDTVQYKWFCQKKFRQAMSCLLNRDRIINQTYRGLAEPKYSFFAEANPFYNPDIKNQYRYDPERAEKLLEESGFFRDENGILHDSAGNTVEFDLTIASSNTVTNDIAMIISDECSKAGIKVNVRQTDFQKMVSMLTSTYDWESLIIGLGTNLFPSQGSNVWPSWGNLHLWNPLQEKPATEWEKRVDELYNKGRFTPDDKESRLIWNEYQRIILEECPVIYLVRARGFTAIRTKWNPDNFYYDSGNGAMTDYVYLAE